MLKDEEEGYILAGQIGKRVSCEKREWTENSWSHKYEIEKMEGDNN